MVEGRTRIEGLIDKRDQLLNDAASIAAKVIASMSQKNGDVEASDVDKLLKDFTADEKYLIMVKIVSILAQNSTLKADDDDNRKKSNKVSSNSIFASRGYK
jgi:hypothetical protein